VTTTLTRPTAATDTGDEPTRPAKTWDRVGFAVLLVVTAVLYLWHITINGMGNQFYAAAAQAGSTDWEALLFGSLDPHNFITVDKPPVSQWVMGLSGQIFGFTSASMLIPQALMAVGAVALLYSASAAGLELATHTAVMAIGGFSGSDPAPTLSQFQDDVAAHKVAYYVVVTNRGHGPGWGGRGHSDISNWVTATFPSTTVGDATVYNLSTPKSAPGS
jgi:Dolichyl-phosphate-mannose-protein mannosyltransferase